MYSRGDLGLVKYLPYVVHLNISYIVKKTPIILKNTPVITFHAIEDIVN